MAGLQSLYLISHFFWEIVQKFYKITFSTFLSRFQSKIVSVAQKCGEFTYLAFSFMSGCSCARNFSASKLSSGLQSCNSLKASGVRNLKQIKATKYSPMKKGSNQVPSNIIANSMIYRGERKFEETDVTVIIGFLREDNNLGQLLLMRFHDNQKISL